MSSTRRQQVERDYTEAVRLGATLCCTDAYPESDVSWIPQRVRAANQGCSSPLAHARDSLRGGEAVLDLGCGAGLDVFLAAKLVGPEGHVIGIDMTEPHLAIARESCDSVRRALGARAPRIEFMNAFMEELPLPSGGLDLVISNCAINLSDSKPAVFAEVCRVLKPGGVFLLADVFAMQEVPFYIKHDRDLLGQCIAGALTVKEGLAAMRSAGMCNIHRVGDSSYSRIDGLEFRSLTVSAHRPGKYGSSTCYATLVGPCSAVVDERGQRFERSKAVEVEASKASLLRMSAYREYFDVREGRPERPQPPTSVLPRPGECKWLGDFATLVGPFAEIHDDDGHVFKAGEAVEVCEKTTDVLAHPSYARLFSVSKRCSTAPNSRAASCGPDCC